MTDVDLEPVDAMRQAGMTAEHYLNAAYNLLMDNGYDEWKVADAIELSKVMAQDFHSAMMCVKMQEIRDAIHELTSLMGKGECT